MINKYEFASKNKEVFYHAISAQIASEYINEFNIYFNYYVPTLPTEIQNLDYYKLDNEKSFDEQYEHIKTLEFPEYVKIFFFTDYKTNKVILNRKIIEAKQVLNRKHMTPSVTNIHNLTKIKKEIIREHFEDLISKNQSVMKFD